MSESDERLATPADTEQPGDNYPDLMETLHLLPEQEDFPTGQVERVEVYLRASGDATWRVWTPRADEPIGGYISPDDFS